MRNRLSAQASRDRRRKAIEDATKQKEARMEEIVFLERRVDEVSNGLLLLLSCYCALLFNPLVLMLKLMLYI